MTVIRHNFSASEILKLDDVAFLKAIISRYPETSLLAGSAEASPEGNPKLKDDALAYKVFGKTSVNDDAIEADRTFLGLLLLKAVINGNRTYFPHLSDSSFAKLSTYTHNILRHKDDVEFVLYSLACNDLGKTQRLVDEYRSLKGRSTDDHDQLLATLVEENPSLFPGLMNLSDAQQTMYREGLGANLNLGQFVQGENLPANLSAFQRIGEKSRNLRLLAEIFDFSGATGHIRHDVSILMNDDNLFAYLSAAEELMREPLENAYSRYIAARALAVGITASSREMFALGRIAALTRSFTPRLGTLIQEVWRNLPQTTRDVLIDELNVSGNSKQTGILLYYAPAVIANSIKAAGSYDEGLKLSLIALGAVYQKARKELPSDAANIVTVSVAPLARQAAIDPWTLVSNLFPCESFLDSIEGKRIAFVGVGGGSDGVQAAILAKLSGRDACVLSVRTSNTKIDENHGGEVYDGVYRVTPETRGTGRFLECIPAELGISVYLIIDKKDGKLAQRLQAALDDFGNIDALYAVDTGGDSLYRTNIDDRAKATPDQDIVSLSALASLGHPHSFSFVVAPGVDTPPYAEDVLQSGKAAFIVFSPREAEEILSLYRQSRMDGNNEERFGKTALAWQAALRNERGNIRLAIPSRYVNHPTNPWNPNVVITSTMAGAFLMRLSDHLDAIGTPAANYPSSLKNQEKFPHPSA